MFIITILRLKIDIYYYFNNYYTNFYLLYFQLKLFSLKDQVFFCYESRENLSVIPKVHTDL
jgi:hypothetical protein